jgi:multicomponent Na+:H+ antiporter subunit G
MSVILQVLSIVLCAGGSLFLVAGTIGLLRFPDVYTRLHALTKADNLGLGLIAVGIALQAGSWMEAWKVLLVWALALVASTTACNLIANAAVQGRVSPWQAESADRTGSGDR